MRVFITFLKGVKSPELSLNDDCLAIFIVCSRHKILNVLQCFNSQLKKQRVSEIGWLLDSNQWFILPLGVNFNLI